MKAKSANSVEDEFLVTVTRGTFGEYCRPFLLYQRKRFSGFEGGRKEENERVNKKKPKK